MIDFLIWPLIFIMLSGFLIVAWLAPLSAGLALAGMFLKYPLETIKFSVLLCLYGLVTTVVIWFTDDMSAMSWVANNPLYSLVPQLVVLGLALVEQSRLKATNFIMKLGMVIALVLSSLGLYWVTLAAVMSASI